MTDPPKTVVEQFQELHDALDNLGKALLNMLFDHPGMFLAWLCLYPFIYLLVSLIRGLR